MTDNLNKHLVPWKLYLTLTAESLLTFYLATFSMAMFFIHRGTDWLALGIIMIALYLFVIGACAKRVFAKLPLVSIMLIIPIAPLIALIIVVSLIPLLELLQ